MHVIAQLCICASMRKIGGGAKDDYAQTGRCMLRQSSILQAVDGEPLPPLQEGETFSITEVDLKQVSTLLGACMLHQLQHRSLRGAFICACAS